MSKLYNSFLLGLIYLLIFLGISVGSLYAQPYDVGVYNADVPYGGGTGISITTSGDVSVAVSPSDGGTLASSSSNITVTSSDVVGYKLYLRALGGMALSDGGNDIPASGNITPGALTSGTWGYNIDNSTNFVGITGSDVLLKDANGPFTTGDITTVYYGVKTDYSTPAGTYNTAVIYTVVPETT